MTHIEWINKTCGNIAKVKGEKYASMQKARLLKLYSDFRTGIIPLEKWHDIQHEWDRVVASSYREAGNVTE